MKVLRVLIACEESQVVCKAFRKRGHEAYSCDIQDCSGGHPEWHIKDDVLNHLNDGWDLMIAHPPCTYLSGAGLHWLKKDPTRKAKLDLAKEFFLAFWFSPIKKVCIENPVGYMNTNWLPASQIIEPYYFGDNHRKRTCLWLRGLPRLNGKIDVALNRNKYAPEPISVDSTGKKRYFTDAKNRSYKSRSKTFPGIEMAMASAWSEDLGNTWNL